MYDTVPSAEPGIVKSRCVLASEDRVHPLFADWTLV
jgi:hypothetical protein